MQLIKQSDSSSHAVRHPHPAGATLAADSNNMLHLLLLAGALCLVSTSIRAQTQFEDVSASAGIDYAGESWGASWGDLNGDGWPDLFVNHHRAQPTLHVNAGDGTLTDITASTFWANPENVGDMHGGAWGDFDNDGDQDFYVTHGETKENHFMVNQGGRLIYRTPQYDPRYPSWRGRMPIWFDFTRDGLLDVMVTSENRAPILEQVGNTFADRSNAAGIECDSNQLGFLADVNADGSLDFICSGASFPGGIYEFRLGVPFDDITGEMPRTGATNDVAIADYDGDLRTDFFMVRGAKRLSGADKVGSNEAETQLFTRGGEEKRAHFVTNGDVSFTLIVEREFSTTDVAIGASGWHPDVNVTKQGGERTMVLTLSSSDPKVVGIAPHNPANTQKVFIGFDPTSQTWTVVNSPGGPWTFLYAGVESTAPVSNVTASGLDSLDRPIEPALVAHKSGGLRDVTASVGLAKDISCVSTAAADFDNDMDVDLYAVCRGANLNVANIYFDNDGNGNFTQVPQAGGAEGPTGARVGLGESVVTADYDIDGNVDLYVTNGLAMNPERVGGPDVLFRNVGHRTNQWIQVDLVGTQSNRDGIGARVLATAGGKTQLREQGGGYHRWSQNDKRLHFGLGNHTSADIVIEWPSGRRDTHDNVAAGSVYRAVEGGAIRVRMPGQDPDAPPPGDDPVISIADASVAEKEGGSSLMFDVTLDRPRSSGNVTVNYRTRNLTAMAGGDYVWENGTVVISPGDVSAVIDIAVVDDDKVEEAHVLTVELSDAINAVIDGTGIAVGTITD
jgi:ASPIC and UnbV/Calx-beta domain/FG-GAP-like repeat